MQGLGSLQDPSERFLFVLSKRNPSDSKEKTLWCVSEAKSGFHQTLRSRKAPIPNGEWVFSIADRAWLRFARGHTACGGRAPLRGEGLINFPVSAATEGSNARFWWLTSFTSRDDHFAELLLRRKAARYASRRSLAFFFGASLPFLWARPKKWGDKDNAGAFAPAIVL